MSRCRYTKEHYDDLAEFIKSLPDPGDTPAPVKAIEVVKSRIAERLADHLAADNPPTCYVNGDHDGECDDGCMTGGFDREWFLKACEGVARRIR